MRITLLLTLLISQNLLAQRVCEEFITDEWPDIRYDINIASEVVLDKRTGLMWKRCSEGVSGASCETGFPAANSWKDALTAATNNNSAVFAGYSDWRLPNIKELRSIVATNCFNPAINETAFPNTITVTYWSSSPIKPSNFTAFSINFNFGFDVNSDVSARVRLVRTEE